MMSVIDCKGKKTKLQKMCWEMALRLRYDMFAHVQEKVPKELEHTINNC